MKNIKYKFSEIYETLTDTSDPYKVKSPMHQIKKMINNLDKKSSNYDQIIREITQYLSVDEVNNLLENWVDFWKPEVSSFINYLRTKSYKIAEAEVRKELILCKQAKNSLNSLDYIAYLLKLKLHLNSQKSTNFIWEAIFDKLERPIHLSLVLTVPLLEKKMEIKNHIPIRLALSVFFLEEKKIALQKFVRILNNDRRDRVDTHYEVEYKQILRHFFDRLGLDYIPTLKYVNYSLIVDFTQTEESVTRAQLEKTIDKFFIPQFFQLIPKAIIKKSKISDINDLKNILILFFKYLDKNSKVKDVDILLHCMIGKSDKYLDNQINDAIDRHCNTLNENDSNRILFLGLCFTLIESKMIKTSLANFSRFIVNYFLKATSLSEATCISHLGEYKRNSTMISDILETPMFLPTAEKINTILKKKIY